MLSLQPTANGFNQLSKKLITKGKVAGRKVLPLEASLLSNELKKAMGVMVKGRSVQTTEKAFELREAQSAYNTIFSTKNRKIAPK